MLKSKTNDDSKVRRERVRRETDAHNAVNGAAGDPYHPGHGGARLIRMKELKVLTGLGRSTIHRLVAQGRFPPPIHPFGHSRVAAWKSTEIDAWIGARFRGEVA